MYAFDLDTAISAWRNTLHHNRAFLPGDLDELETHLRDHVDALTASGIPLEAAFEQALKRLGAQVEMETEYRKVRHGRTRRKETLRNETEWRLHMLKNYVVIALRNLRREKVYAGINIFGLAVGIACVLLVFLYVRHEFSFDNFNTKSDRIYRILEHGGFTEKEWRSYVEGDPVDEMRTSYTDVEDAVRFMPLGAKRIHFDGQFYPDVKVVATEPNFFNIFTLPLISGDPSTALDRPHTAIITRSLAQRLFKESDPLGKTIPVTMVGNSEPVEITGVMEDVPENAHFTFDLLFSYATLEGSILCTTCGQPMYALLKPGADPNAIAKRLLTRITKVDGKEHVDDVRLEALQDIYFSDVSNLSIYGGKQGSKSYTNLLTTIAAVILLIACANYMNLATARSARRAREVGIRKVVGAHRSQVVRQFLSEALVLVLLALPLALVLLVLVLPVFNTLADSHVALSWSALAPLVLGCLAALLVIGLIGGSYPALYLSSFEPVQVLKGRVVGTFSAAFVRKGLVVFQFAASIVLIAATVVVMRQLRFVQEQELGFQADQIITIKLQDPDLYKRGTTIAQELARTSGVLDATASWVPGQRNFMAIRNTYAPDGETGLKVPFIQTPIDTSFLRTMHITLLAGRNITSNINMGQNGIPKLELLVNETAVRRMGWHSPEEALGKALDFGHIVGVTKDFNFESLHQGITPLVLMQNGSKQAGSVALKLRGSDIPSTLAALKKTWTQLAPGTPFEFSFLKDEINRQYEREQRAGKVFGIFAGLAILLACLGLFGLTAFTAMSRTKEIGIRKVLGASASDVVVLLSKDFVLLLLVAFVLALPVAYVAMNHWLEDFAYHIRIGPGIFLAAGTVALVIAIASVSLQVLRTAHANPADSLRYE